MKVTIKDKQDKLSNINNQIEALQKRRKQLEFEIDKECEKGNYLKVSIMFIVDGIIENKQVTYSRSREKYAFTFDDFIYHASMIEKYNGNGSTYLNYLIEKYAKVFNIDKDKEDELMDLYWYNKKKTFQDVLSSYKSKGWDKIHPTEQQFIQSKIYGLYKHFFSLPDELRRGFLLMLTSKSNTIDDIIEEIEATPKFIREYVNNFITSRMPSNR